MSEHPSTPAPRRPLTPRERRERRRIRRRRLFIRRCLIVLVGVLLVLAIVGILSGIVRLASGGGQSAGGLTDSQPASSAQSAPPAALSFAGALAGPNGGAFGLSGALPRFIRPRRAGAVEVAGHEDGLSDVRRRPGRADAAAFGRARRGKCQGDVLFVKPGPAGRADDPRDL